MFRQILSLFAIAALLAGGARFEAGSQTGGPITGPAQHDNLAVYFVKADGAVSAENALTLNEALKQGLVTVHETGEVDELAIDNKSDHPIFIQAGEIVKGGRQDRALAMDLLVPPQSEDVPIPSFCVERGRWTGRSGESATQVEVSSKALASKELKMAAMYQKSQSDVWQNVDEVNRKLSKVVGQTVNDPRSATSLQLALENDSIESRLDDYIEAMDKALAAESNVIGIAIAINGEINSADIYRSPGMFAKCWPKLIEAAATEALAGSDQPSGESPSTTEIAEWLAHSASLSVIDEQWGTGIIVRMRDGDNTFVNELLESTGEEKVIHRTVLMK